MDKIQEIFTTITVSVVGIFGFMAKRLFTTVDNCNNRIDKLEKNLVDRRFLESQIDPIRSDLNLILKHLLEKK